VESQWCRNTLWGADQYVLEDLHTVELEEAWGPRDHILQLKRRGLIGRAESD